MARISAATFFAASAALVAVAKANSIFVNPEPMGKKGDFSENPTYEVGERLVVEWESDLDSMNLLIYQEYPRAEGDLFWYGNLLLGTGTKSFNWRVSFDDGRFITEYPEDENAIFFFSLYEGDTNNIVASSQYFNVTVPEEGEDEVPTSTSADPTGTPTEAPTAISDPPDNTDDDGDGGNGGDAGNGNDSGDNNNGDDGDDGGMGTGAVAGIAVGATVGGIALIAGLGFMLWRRKRAAKAQTQTPYAPPSEMDSSHMGGASTAYASPHSGHGPYAPPGNGQYAPVDQYEYYKPQQTEPSEMASNDPAFGHGYHPPNARGPPGLHEAP